MLIRQKGEDFIFPKADGTAKLSGRDYEFREPTVRPEPTVRIEDLWRNPRRIGRVPTGRTNRWRWSPCRFLVDPGRNISCSTDIYMILILLSLHILIWMCYKRNEFLILEVLYKTNLAWYHQETARSKEPNCQHLETAVKTSCWSDDENSKLQSPERCCGKGISHQESKKGKKAYVGKVGKCFQWKETHVVSIMIQESLETVAQRSETKRTIVFSCIPLEGKTNWRRGSTILTGIRQQTGKHVG